MAKPYGMHLFPFCISSLFLFTKSCYCRSYLFQLQIKPTTLARDPKPAADEGGLACGGADLVVHRPSGYEPNVVQLKLLRCSPQGEGRLTESFSKEKNR